jgi:hypothetical protein
MILLGYIPVTKLECFTEARRSDEAHQLFHECMRILLEPLCHAGRFGVDMVCADGLMRSVYPIIASYIADHPEQCLIAGCKESRCPRCIVPTEDLGEFADAANEWPHRNANETVSSLVLVSNGLKSDKFDKWGLKRISPFWADQPHLDIFKSLTPDILHQLHKGLFGDHVRKWCIAAAEGGEFEVDRRFQVLPGHVRL